MNTQICENSNSDKIEEWLSKNDLYICLPLNAKITCQTCITNKNTYKQNLKDDCIPKELLEKVEYCVFKCNGLTKNN